ncbi:MAG: glycoside hydrolase family 97 protein [Bacteroidota bacterium]|nr:glycoside hydrolase family 97 protein [Bacteroidota bacterium]
MKRFILSAICFLTIYIVANAQNSVMSPNSLVEAKVEVGSQIVFSVYFNGKPVIANSEIRFVFKQAPPMGDDMIVLKTSSKVINETWTPVLKRTATILNNYRELTLQMQEKKFPRRIMNLVFRVFDDGVAFRTEFIGSGNNHDYVITDELVTFNFTADHTCWAANHGNYRSSQENEYFKRKLSDITENMVIGLPMTVKVADDCYAAITEANITDYAGMYLKQGNSKNGFSVRSNLAPLPDQPENGDKVRFKFPHKTPWRVIMLGDSPGKLIESEIVMNLNEPCAIADPSWIKPGICAWDHWWSGEVKVDNETIKKYIDLASEMGWPYQLIDWQWYGQFNNPEADITKVAQQLDMPGILAYAKSKNVKCWFWLYYNDVNRADFDKACALYESWGIAGVKIDFMDSDDQEMVNWYHRIVKTAAKHHLMVDFHGAYKPDGFRRTYPNLVTREGVLGNEYNKWSLRITPEHMVTLPFTRMLAGPMDFTPGGFLNRTPEKFENGTPAQVQGTRALQLAQFVVYDSPFQVACDHPDNYKGQVGTEFLKKVKTMWDDTKILNGQIGEYITSARRSGNEWFIGSMTNSETRTLEIKLDFLGAGKYKMVAFEDAPDATINAENVMRTTRTVVKGDVIKMRMATGGGFAAWLEPVK